MDPMTAALVACAESLIAEIQRRDGEGNTIPEHLYRPLATACAAAKAATPRDERGNAAVALGRARSPAKKKAAQENGAKGGRPVYRLCPQCEQRVRLFALPGDPRGVYYREAHSPLPANRHQTGENCTGSGGRVDLREG